MNAFMMEKEQILETLKTDPDAGLTCSQVIENAREHGANVLSGSKPVSLFSRVIGSVKEPMLIMLILAAVISVAVNVVLQATGEHADFLECAGILAAIALSVAITVVMEGKSAKAFEALAKITEDTVVKAIRDGRPLLLHQREIVAGDIIMVETGDKVPADGRLLESSSLQADESSLTGESVPAEKSAGAVYTDAKTPVAERANMLYSGSFITNGSGKMAVTGVGFNTEFGKIAAELSVTEKTTTPLQEKLAKMGKLIAFFGTAAAAVAFVAQLLIFIARGEATFAGTADAFITSIVLIVAAVPEGLPTIVAVSLAINIIKMSKHNALVKKMVACETIGCINVICSDKTGTLTENRMTVVGVYDGKGVVKPEALKNGALIDNFCLNGTADVNFGDGAPKPIGNPTECALLFAANASGHDYRAIRFEHVAEHVFPFSSENKNMTSIFKTEDGYTAFSKGSPEKIFSMCDISEKEKAEAARQIVLFQEKACRVIAFARKTIAAPANGDYDAAREEIEKGMTFDGFAAITDPVRGEVREALNRCRSAGINVKILTGDNIITAKAIADELDLLDGGVAAEARELEHLSDEELTKALAKIRIIARSTPAVKMRVVKLLKAGGNVVAVTGDGINDAPAIKNADAGIAMGVTGTEVSKEAADIVLLDDSFATIVKAVQWGRGIYENFQRFIVFQLTVNLSSVMVVLASVLLGLGAPFTALQLLWINIIMDGPPALTLGLEPIRDDLMKRAPTKRNASIVSRGMLAKIVTNGVFIFAVSLSQHKFDFLGAGPEREPTVFFTLFVMFQLFNAFNSRETGDASIFENFTRNKMMILAAGAAFVLQILITQFGGAFFKTVPLPFVMWLKIIGAAAAIVVISEAVKLIKRRTGKTASPAR
ncbi:MAG: calcium-translocating P-type ATPase, PMCA-type [Oscillospiraceae bacterium]|jgi:Ca2+-transporting ATPase|nr:calcium-translocating P-type ATPase, PMCA-type [Oscillospiraceae bacterium]